MFDAIISGFNGFGQLNGFDSDVVDGGQTWSKRENIRLITATWSHVILVNGENQNIEIWGFVGNEAQQKKILQNKPFTENLIQIACNSEKMFVVTSSGDIWQLFYKTMVWRNLRYTINEKSEDDSESKPRVRKVAVGETMTLALTSSGKVYRLPGEEINIPNECGPVIDIACGKEHCLLLTAEKRLFACGSSLRGQLGYGGLDSFSDPVELDALAGMNVTSVAAGGFHSAAITDAGDLYTWGWNKAGQLGHPVLGDSESSDGVLVLPEPRAVEFKTQRDAIVKNVACGASHTIATLGDGTVWACGWNKWKQFGQDEPRQSGCMIKLDVKIPCDAKSLDISCAPWNSIIFWKN